MLDGYQPEDPRKKIAAYTSMHVATKILANQV